MKVKLLFIILFGCISLFAIYAQDIRGLQGPVHPLNDYRTRTIDVDTVYSYVYSETEDGDMQPRQTATTIFTRSEDRLTDTLFIMSGIMGHFVERYSEKNQLLYRYDYYPRHPDQQYVKTVYEYDEEGRLVHLITYVITPTEPPLKVIDNEFVCDYSTLRMTEKGYIFNNVEYELDDQGRVTYIKNLESEDIYVEYTDGEKYRMGDKYYTYTDSSCTVFGYYHFDNAVVGMPDMWATSVYVYNERGYFKSNMTSKSLDGIWRKWSKVENRYAYSNNIPDNNEPISSSDIKVYGLSGAIHICLENESTVQIYNLSGQIVKQQSVSPGENQIYLSQGLYLVVVGHRPFKIFVR